MDLSDALDVLWHGNQLKRTARTGWVQRGIVNAESVAAHSYGVCYITLILAQLVDKPVALDKALAMATLHDLAEGLTTDLPPAALQFLPPGAKRDMERQAMATILNGAEFGPRLMALWDELHENLTAEARLVHDADKLDMFLQATIYETQTGNRQLSEFWGRTHVFHFAEARAIYDELKARRDDQME